MSDAAPSSRQLPVVLFDDARGLLAPLTDLRPSFAVRTGALRLLDRIERKGWTIRALIVRQSLAGLAAEQFDHPVNDLTGLDDALAINGRCVLPPERAATLARGEAIAEAGTGDVLAARVDAAGLRALARDEALTVKVVEEAPAPALMARPWHIRTFRDAALAADLALAPPGHSHAAEPGAIVIGDHRIAIAPTARIMPGAILDAETGPIWVDEYAIVRPGATVIGPAYIGPHATIIDHALIKANTAIGPCCKVGGEVGGTIFQGYANKAHEGHLGDSWVGEWANLGAGTTNSNLLNTYGEVTARATPEGKNERTGEQFLGAIIGDHARFAISTCIMTGAVVGTGVMWAASSPVSGCIERFAWVTDKGERRYRLDKFIEVARTVMARRRVDLSEAYVSRFRSLAGE